MHNFKPRINLFVIQLTIPNPQILSSLLCGFIILQKNNCFSFYERLPKVINVEQRQAEGWMVTEEGSEVVEKGSHEFLVFQAVPPEGLPQEEVKVKLTRLKQ